VIYVGVHVTSVAAIPLKVTLEEGDETPNPMPEMYTKLPGIPEDGVTLEIWAAVRVN